MKCLPGLTSGTLGMAATILALAYLAPGNAQDFRGSINGYVTDNSGAMVPNAKIQAVQQDTGAIYNTVSSGSGQFQFQDMPLGKYRLTITASGFQVTKFDDIPVSARVVYSAPVTLTVGEAVTTVDVQADQIVLDTSSQTLSTVISTQLVGDMPRNGRDYTQNIILIPGSNVAGGSGITSIIMAGA